MKMGETKIDRQLKFIAAYDEGEVLYAVDEEGKGIFRINKETGVSQMLFRLPTAGNRKILYQAVEKYKDKIFFFPYQFAVDRVLVYYLSEQRIEYVDLFKKNELISGEYRPLQRVGDVVWLFPVELQKELLVFDLPTEKVRTIASWKTSMREVQLAYSNSYSKVTKMIEVGDVFYLAILYTNIIIEINKYSFEIQIFRLPNEISLFGNLDYDGKNIWMLNSMGGVTKWNPTVGTLCYFPIPDKSEKIRFKTLLCGKKYIWLIPYQYDDRIAKMEYQTGNYQFIHIFPGQFLFDSESNVSIFEQIHRRDNLVDLYPFNGNLTIHIDLEKDILERHEVISLPEEWSDNDILKYELENSYESKRVSPTLFLNSFLHEISQNKEKPSRISNGKKIWEEISKIKDKNG